MPSPRGIAVGFTGSMAAGISRPVGVEDVDELVEEGVELEALEELLEEVEVDVERELLVLEEVEEDMVLALDVEPVELGVDELVELGDREVGLDED